jgi:hypothetical protein
MTQEITIIPKENVSAIVQSAQQVYDENKMSCTKCNQAGESILNAIQTIGMNDELDQQASAYIEKSKKTLKKMTERRSPMTKLFDDIRKQFTALENEIDPTKANTLPNKLQNYRNQYAAQKRAEEVERQRKEYERQQAEMARQKMRQDIEVTLWGMLHEIIFKANMQLGEIDNAINLANYDESVAKINAFPTELPNLIVGLPLPMGVSKEEMQQAEMEVKAKLNEQFRSRYTQEVESTKQCILVRLPSKKANLERIAKSSAEEAERLQREAEEVQRREAMQREAERLQREAEDKQQAEMARQQAEMESLFTQQVMVEGAYQHKVKVAQKIVLLNAEGIMPIISMWWTKEGCHLPTEELAKMFKKQITFCEKLAKEGVYIQDESVEYVEAIKAK